MEERRHREHKSHQQMEKLELQSETSCIKIALRSSRSTEIESKANSVTVSLSNGICRWQIELEGVRAACKSKSVWLILLLVLSLAQQSFSVVCYYLHLNLDMGYACELVDVNFVGKSEGFLIEGEHEDGLSDSDVLSVFATNSNISYVPEEILLKFVNLERLLMSQVAMEDIALKVCQVYTITFYRNKLTKIYPRGFENCTNLENLDLGDNRIESIPKEAFEGISNLQSLVIDNNPIKFIDPSAFEKLLNLRKLYSLNIEVPEILPQFFSSFKKIEWIFFGSSSQRNVTRLLTGTFKSLHELKYLYVKGNSGDEMEIEEAAFEDLESLWSLDLSGNSIKRLNTDSFKGLSNLCWLYLEENRILEVERSFLSNFPKLERLNVKENFCINQTFFSDGDPFGGKLSEDFEGCYVNWEETNNLSTSTEPQVTPSTTTSQSIIPTTQGSSAANPNIFQIASFYCICSILWRI